MTAVLMAFFFSGPITAGYSTLVDGSVRSAQLLDVRLASAHLVDQAVLGATSGSGTIVGGRFTSAHMVDEDLAETRLVDRGVH